QRNSIAVVDRHSESELRSAFQRRQTESRLRQFYLVSGFLLCEVAFNDRCCRTVTRWISAWTCLVVNNNASIRSAGWVGGNKGSRRVFVAAKRVIVKCYLLGPGCIGDHKLDRIAIPGVAGDVFMVIVRHDESEVNVVSVIG